jgi:hypothetical protein
VPSQDETISAFVARLRAAGEKCQFDVDIEDMSKLEEAIRDRLLCGCGDPSIQNRLLEEPADKPLTLKRAMELATAIESASQNA